MDAAGQHAYAEALFCSPLQPSQHPTGDQVRHEVLVCELRYGADGCAALLAQAYGEDPEATVERMRWCLTAVDALHLAGV
jgi:hypothetical protein